MVTLLDSSEGVGEVGGHEIVERRPGVWGTDAGVSAWAQ